MADKAPHRSSEIEAQTDVAKREEKVLAFWSRERIFEKSLLKEAPEGEFVFYDGPPFATGLPHYGHILAGTIKDAIPRYSTMRGYRVTRKWGWDCHGLPLENIIEKKLGLATKKDIEELGVETFNEAARNAVLEFVDDWKRIVPRMGRWADMENDYKTMDPNYTESVWHVFHELYKKDLVYEGFKSMHLCPRCGTTLSNFEVNQGYTDIKDISVYIKLPLVDLPDTSLLVWTTTPWTLPGNMAAAVNSDTIYVKVAIATKEGELEKLILAKDRLDVLEGSYSVLEEVRGKDLTGLSYVPPFDYYKDTELTGKENAWKIYHADYVDLTDGTGAVHLAPAYGEEDMELAERHGIPIVHHVGEDGCFLKHVTDFAGEPVKPKDDQKHGVSHLDADIEIVKALNASGKLYKKENITHSYPLCWRCDTPLLNYAKTSWFVNVTNIKDGLVKENLKVHWVPKHVGHARFGKWLEGVRDWAISRQRYWGAPLPIWRNPETKEYKVLGSLKDLKKLVKRSGNTYFLMRHGEAESNASKVASTDVAAHNPLTEKGKQEVSDAIKGLKKMKIDLIMASPYERTRMTAQMVAEELGIHSTEIVYDDRIGEIKLGTLDGNPVDEYHAFLDAGEHWSERAPDGGESWQDVKRRAGVFLYEVDSKYENKNILIISHNSPLRMFGAINDGVSLETTAFDHDKDGIVYGNGEVRELPFVPLPHNREYELDYHRPYIDEIELVDKDGARLERVPDVFDCWFESGSMPYGQQHYPFENLDTFNPKKEIGYPADFIAEGLDQTRGWFYSLIVLGTALFGRSPYKHVIVNGTVLAEDGQKMSKKLQNYPDPMLIAGTYGADTMRFYLLSSPVIKGEDLNFSEKSVGELARKNIGRLHNVLTFYNLYRDDSIAPSDGSKDVLDKWIIARTRELVGEVSKGFENYELDKATRPITDFIDDLSVWYVRRSRQRMKTEGEDKSMALATLRFVLRQLATVMAPSMPFYADYLFGEVKETSDPKSVHLAAWPKTIKMKNTVLDDMEIVRNIVSLALEARAKAGIKVRQPLRRLKVKSENLKTEFHSLILDEVNVKKVECDTSISEKVVLDTELTEELQTEGKARDLMRSIQDMRKQKGLAPQDVIKLQIDTDEVGRSIISSYQKEILATTSASSIDFMKNDGARIEIGDRVYTVTIMK